MELVGIFWDAAIRLFGCGNVHAAYVYKLKENLVSLQRKWDHLQDMSTDVRRRIEDAEGMGEMRRTNEVNGWLQEVQNLQKVIGDIQAEGSQETHNICLSGCPKNCVSSYKLGKKVVKMLNEVDKLEASGKHFVDKIVDIAYKLPPKVVDEMPSVETVGLDLMFDKVKNSFEDENVGIIGLYGMGGAGKTTLMKRIHNELGKWEHDFALVLWLVVSKDFDVNKIMNDIRNRLGINDDIWNKSNQDQRVAKIYQVLKQKKFVLMLDDLWGKLELELVGVPLPKSTNNQSKVLFTTRYEDVCAKMQAQKKFKVECLLEQEAFDLFCRKVGEETLKCHGEILELAQEMATECGGLPLALITVGSAMAGVNSVEAWRQAKSDLISSPWIASDLEEKVFCVLKFSYDRLPDETHKSCFLYCALYPEDYEIRVDGLIDRWIGEGFLGEVKSKSIYDMYEQGESIITKLRLSSMLEGVEIYDDTPRPSLVKMHDVIRDMALWLTRDQDRNKDKFFSEKEVLAMSQMEFGRLNVVERISVLDNPSQKWQVPACPNLLTLCVHGNLDGIGFSNLQFMTRLKILDLCHVNFPVYIPIEISKLIQLEFLSLSRGKLRNSNLPIEFKNLKNLRIFLMEDVTIQNGLESIPVEVIASLERLTVFRFYTRPIIGHAGREEAFLKKLESLPELEELCMELRTITGMKVLLESNKLRCCSRHFMLHGIEQPLEMPSLLASLSTMKHLDGIRLISIDDIKEGSSINDTCRLRKLRWVNIKNCDSITHLTWLRYAPLLEFLMVNRCDSIEEVVKGAADEDGGSVTDNANDIFPNLRRLCLAYLPKLKSIYVKALPFPFLKSIRIKECSNLKKLPLNSISAKDSLIEIVGDSGYWWNNLEWEEQDIAAKDHLHSKFKISGSWVS